MRAALAVSALLAMSAAAHAQQREQVGPITIEFRTGIISEEGEEAVLVAAGSVRMTEEGAGSLRADRIVAWWHKEKRELREAYLEGNVVARIPDPQTGRELLLRAERMYYDFINHRAYVIDLVGRVWMERIAMPVTIRAREARSLSRGHWKAEDMELTTCSYGVPHFHVHFAHGELRGRREKSDPSLYDLWPYRGWNVRGEGIGLDLFGARVPLFPAFEADSAIIALPIRSVRGGASNRYGYWVESDWGVNISKKYFDAINPFDNSGPDDDDEKWLDLMWEIDYRSRRGPGGGLDPRWESDSYHGYIDSYYMRDEGGDPDIDFDAQFIGQYGENRGRARLFHRHNLNANWRWEAEASYLSDRALLPEFFEKEFKEGKDQETVGYVRWIDHNWGGYAMARARLNDFQTQNEYLPRVRGFVFDQHVALGLTATVHADAARIRARFDEDLNLPSEEVQRGDAFLEIARPFDLGIATFSPFARARGTVWDQDLAGERETRFLGTAGARLSTSMAGTHDVEWDAIGLRRLRHVGHFEVAYANNFESTLEDSSLFGFDSTDTLDRFEEVSFHMRHRFQTKSRRPDGTLGTREFMSLGLAAEYYPDSVRDTQALRADNFEAPFHWIALATTDELGTLPVRDWSNIHYDARFEPLNIVALTFMGEYNPELRQEEVRVYGVSVRPWPIFAATVGEVFVKDVTTAFTVGVDWQITDKWRVEAGSQYDFDIDEFLNWRATVTRDFHDFNLEVVAEVDETRDERRFYVTAYPKFIRRP